MRNSRKICSTGFALWFAAKVLLFSMSAGESRFAFERNSANRISPMFSRSVKWPACSCIDQPPCHRVVNICRGKVRNISSKRAGVPRNRSKMHGYNPAERLKSNLRSNHLVCSIIPMKPFFRRSDVNSSYCCFDKTSTSTSPLQFGGVLILSISASVGAISYGEQGSCCTAGVKSAP